ncbi:MAG TPA: TAT-variant-translocated molybdopterin oxidoreductase [Candidatus Dormibacteraeota bacterium]|nr:TAT-variant-translocated molybdopterin oxidoreductase [Candidatus Dormibacteraeota bacterium]
MSEDPKLKKLPNDSVDLDVARANLAKMGKKRLWQSLEELSDTKTYREFKENEFPAAYKDSTGINRRDVLKLMAASAAMAGLSACTKLPQEKIVPYVRPPEEIVPGNPLFYATSIPEPGGAVGLLVESHMGRPTKIEGNPQHPGSLGATDALQQASILNMYDPDRAQSIRFDGQLSSWNDFVTAMSNVRARMMGKGAGIRVLTTTVTSPTFGAQMKDLLAQFPGAKWHQYEPSGNNSARVGSKLAFGRAVNAVYQVDQADVVVSLDADFLMIGPGHVRYIREFAGRRSLPNGPSSNLNRLYVVESMPTSTGAMSDHRLPMRSGEVETFTRQLAAAVGVSAAPAAGGSDANIPADWLKAVADDLTAHRGSSLVIAGENQPPVVHAIAHAINAALGNVGKTVVYTESIEAEPVDQLESIKNLVADLNSNKVDFLLVLGGNPVYDAPADLDFVNALIKAKLRVYYGLYFNETSEWCHWEVPATHFLEGWSDARAYDGTAGVVQPLIAPLYDSHSDHEIVAILTGQPNASSHELVRQYWQGQRPEKGKAFEDFWELTLYRGYVAGTALPPVNVPLQSDFLKQTATPVADASALEVVFRPDPSIGDGLNNNNSWLQELPKPITRLTWDNAAMVSPDTAKKLGINTQDYVELDLNGRKVFAPVFVTFGHADNSVTVHFGYGRLRTGAVGTGTGFNAYMLRTSDQPHFANGLQVKKTDKNYPLAVVQHQYTVDSNGHAADEESVAAVEHRDLVQIATLDEFRKDPTFAKHDDTTETKDISLYPNYKYDGYAWAMSIDLNRCVGCNACVIACQSENNIAVVGKDQTMRGRVMHWIRIDTYFRGGLENPETFFEPLPCMQCENAPCEYVCPVGATTHTPEGLNDMTYNRCVGTRYCSNNCPWKVRRFNFFLYSDWDTKSLYGVRNPDVTVRSRGVMEKCTYCVQRIQEAKIRATREDRLVRDGEIVTACQQVCPAQAITFGNINDKNSQISKLKANERDYVLLADLNTRPRTSYLARVRNPNPAIRV